MQAVFEVINAIWNQLKPPQAFSWQTLILLSLFSWALSFLVLTLFLQEWLAWMGWLFLSGGVGWSSWGTKLNLLGWVFRPGPWITGALVCSLFFWWQGETSILPLVLTLWPLISAAIAIIPRCLPNLNPTLPDPATRQELIILLLTALLMSCWFRFHFLTQDWLINYPSLLSDDLSRSGLGIRIDQGAPPQRRGDLFLNRLEFRVKETLEGRRWSEVERWLLDRDTQLVGLRSQIQATRGGNESATEDALWHLQAEVPPEQPSPTTYQLNLQAFWLGPSSRSKGYVLQKKCQVTQVVAPTNPQVVVAPPAAPPEPLATIQCELGSQTIWLDDSQNATERNSGEGVG